MSKKSKLFMILDDEQSIHQSITSFLEDEGHRVLIAENTETALDLVKKNPVDAAVVDIRLPGKDGHFFITRAAEIRPDMKMVIHTGLAEYELPEALIKLGFNKKHILTKPVRNMTQILDALGI